MKIKSALIAASALLTATVFAAPVSPEQAMSRALTSGPRNAMSSQKGSMRLVHTEKSPSGIASAYVFSYDGNKGFVILSADDVALPVLGYSSESTFDPENIPVQLQSWLEGYGRQIEWLTDSNAEATYGKPYAPSNWSPVSPLLKTIWNQDAPYNNQCPLINGNHAMTGCVATAASQVMNYFKYPEAGNGYVRYTDNIGAIRSLYLDQGFKWNDMLDSYSTGKYTDSQASAVAYLMACCGYASEMNYTLSASGTQSYKMKNAFIDRFYYPSDIVYHDRIIFSATQWAEKIYQNLKNVGPVYYDGASYEGGHAFVCDGYDGAGYFHFNWGWGGLSDGYYLLDTLNPSAIGIGGSEGGFNYNQSAIFNIRKPDGKLTPDYDHVRLYGSIDPVLEGRTLTFTPYNDYGQSGWGNGNYRSMVCQLGMIIENADGSVNQEMLADVTYLSSNRLSLSVGQLLSGKYLTESITVPQLPDGTYRVVAASRQYGTMENGSNYPWQPVYCAWGDINYCMLTVSGGNLSIQKVSPKKLAFSGTGLSSPLYFRRNARLGIELTNNSDIELTSSFYPALYSNGQLIYRGDYMLATVPAAQSQKFESVIRFTYINANDEKDPYYPDGPGPGTYTLVMLDSSSGTVLKDYGQIDMGTVTSNFKIELEDFEVPGATVKNLVRGSQTFNDAYEIWDASDFEIELSYVVKTGYFDSPLRIFMAEYNEETNKFVNLPDDVYYDTPFTGVGKINYLTLPMNMSNFNTRSVYRVAASYQYKSNEELLGMMYIGFDPAAVDGVLVDDENVTPEYYNLQGMKVDHPEKGQILVKRIGSKTQKIIF